jgi:uncharacterized protein YdhG (YjbR/CyaY superfamily)
VAEHFATVDDYVAALPDDARDVLERIRATVRTALPGAGETIRYNMPTVTYDGEYVIHVAAWKHHIGPYPMPVLGGGIEAQIAPYRAAKDSVRFPYGKPVPYELIGRVVALIAAEEEG